MTDESSNSLIRYSNWPLSIVLNYLTCTPGNIHPPTQHCCLGYLSSIGHHCWLDLPSQPTSTSTSPFSMSLISSFLSQPHHLITLFIFFLPRSVFLPKYSCSLPSLSVQSPPVYLPPTLQYLCPFCHISLPQYLPPSLTFLLSLRHHRLSQLG